MSRRIVLVVPFRDEHALGPVTDRLPDAVRVTGIREDVRAAERLYRLEGDPLPDVPEGEQARRVTVEELRDLLDNPPTPTGDPDLELAPRPAQVRQWARRTGITVGVRGRIPDDVLDAYRAAHAPAPDPSGRAPGSSHATTQPGPELLP